MTYGRSNVNGWLKLPRMTGSGQAMTIPIGSGQSWIRPGEGAGGKVEVATPAGNLSTQPSPNSSGIAVRIFPGNFWRVFGGRLGGGMIDGVVVPG